MPINDGNQAISKKHELFMVAIVVDCDGTTNTVREVRRLNRPIARDATTGEIVFQGDEIVTVFPFAQLPGALQTALTNFVNAVDTK